MWKKWPDATIPYLISSRFSQYERSVIARAIKVYHTKTCIRFVPHTGQVAVSNVTTMHCTALRRRPTST